MLVSVIVVGINHLLIQQSVNRSCLNGWLDVVIASVPVWFCRSLPVSNLDKIVCFFILRNRIAITTLAMTIFETHTVRLGRF